MTKKELNQHKKVRKHIKKLFIGNLIKQGNKKFAVQIFFDFMNYLKLRIKNKDPFKLLVLAVRRASPVIRLRNKRFGALIHKLPYFLPSSKAKSYAIR
jgi:ribosomal protein S7